MEWDDEDNESNENAESNNVTDKSETSTKVHLRKSFIPHKKRVILQELEPISENNILEDCSDYLSKSINFNVRQRQKNMNPPQCSYRSTGSGVSEAAQTHPETPPATLRQRIIEAQEMREYLEKELNELKDFTTSEQQVLAVEKGVEELKSSLDDANNKLEICCNEKDLICKELEEMKRKYVDEQTEKQILEEKWKHREDDLKRSLEEAWSLLRIKEDRITKMNEKISFLYSEREKVKDLNFTFGGQLLPSADEHTIQTVEQNISELFELYHDSLDIGRTLNHNQGLDCKGDCVQNKELSEVSVLMEELAKYKHSIEMHKRLVEDLNKNLADKNLLICTYENNLSELENYLSDCFSNDLICMDKEDNQTNKTSFEKIKYNINFFLSQLDKQSNEKEINTLKIDVSIYEENIKQKEEEITMLGKYIASLEETIKSRIEEINVLNNKISDYEKNLTASQNEMSAYTVKIKNLNEEMNLMSNQVSDYEEKIKFQKDEINALQNKNSKYEEAEINCKEDVHILQTKVTDYEEKIKNFEDEINILQGKISDYKEKKQSNEKEINMLKSNVSVYEENIKQKEDEINVLVTKISDHNEEEEIHSKEEIHILQTKVTANEEKIKNFEEEINILQIKISDYEEKKQSNEKEINTLKSNVSVYEENIRQKEEEISIIGKNVASLEETIKSNIEEINILNTKISGYKEEGTALQNEISSYKDKIKNNEEEMNLILNKVSNYEDKINLKQDEIKLLQNEISRYEEKFNFKQGEIVNNYEDEIYSLKNEIFYCKEKSQNKDEEINILQSKISVYEEKIRCNDDEINELKNNVSSYEDKINFKDEELNLLGKNVASLEETIKSNLEERDSLLNKISEDEDIIKQNEEELCLLGKSVLGLEETIKSKTKEMNTLLSKVAEYEGEIQSNAEEIDALKNEIFVYKDKIQNFEKEMNLMSDEVSHNEEKTRCYDDEINSLKNQVVVCEEKLRNKEEEINMIQKNLDSYGETINENKQEIKTLLSKVSEYEDEIKTLNSNTSIYEENTKQKEDELSMLRTNISGLEETIQRNIEKINNLHNTISVYEEENTALHNEVSVCKDKIQNNEEEINSLLDKVSGYEEKMKFIQDEISSLQNEVSKYEEKQVKKDEEIHMLQTKIAAYDEKIKKYEEEIKMLQNNVSIEEILNHNIEEINILKSKITDYEKITQSNEKEIYLLRNNASNYEEKIQNKEDEICMLRNTLCDLEETIKNKMEEIRTLLAKVAGYEEEITALKNEIVVCKDKIQNTDKETDLLINKLSRYKENINFKQEEISTLQIEVSSYKEKCANKEEEIVKLQTKVIAYDEKIKNYEDEIQILQSRAEEINILLSKISVYEEKIQCNDDEINELKNNVSSYKEKINLKDEELNLLGKNVVSLKETIINNLEEINVLNIKISDYQENVAALQNEMSNKVSDYEEKINFQHDKLNALQNQNSKYEEEEINSKEDIRILQTKVTDYEEKIKNFKDEIMTLKCSIGNEEIINPNIEEINLLQIKISDYEEIFQSKEKEINTLKNSVSCYEERVKQKEEEISMLRNTEIDLKEKIESKIEEVTALQTEIAICKDKIQKNDEEMYLIMNKVSGYEENINFKQDELNMLQNEALRYEAKINQKEEELSGLRKNNAILEEIIESNMEEINFLNVKMSGFEEEVNVLQNEVSSYKDKIKNNEEKMDSILNKVSGYEDKIKHYEEEINCLNNELFDYKEIIKNKEKEMICNIEEINILHGKISEYKEKVGQKEEELIMLGKNVTGLEETIKCNVEGINVFQTKVSGYEEQITALKRELSIYKDKVHNSEEEMNIQILSYEKTVESYVDEINLLKNQISSYEQGISESLPHGNVVSESLKNVDGFNNTDCSTILDDVSASYSHDMVNVGYDILSADNTLNFTTLDSSSQLEQSVFISKLPPTDTSIKEYDPLASVRELSYNNEDLETTLTEQVIKPCAFENLNLLQRSNLINSTFTNYNNNENIKTLIHLLNNERDMLNSDFEDVSKQLSVVKELLKPKEDFVIYSLCNIIENILNKEFSTKQTWNEKMSVIKETLSNLQNIKDSFSKLKNSFSSLENITSQDYETINSHLKNLFLCNRELASENGLLKEQLKVSLLSEEKLSKINELLRIDLTEALKTENDLMTTTKHNKNLEDKLKEKCDKENEIILLIDKIATLLNPNFSWPADRIIKKLEQVYSLLLESIHLVDLENLHELGFLNFFRNLVTQNNVLKQKINPDIKIIKGDLTSLNDDITHRFKNLNADFYTISCKLSELYEKQELESSVNCVLRDNMNNLILEKRELKEELNNLRILNNNLNSASKDAEILMDKYKHLNNIIQEKDDLLSDHIKFQEQVCSFVDDLEDLYFIKDFHKLNSSFSFTDKSNYLDFLAWLKTFLTEVHCVHESLLQNMKSSHHYNLNEAVGELLKEKNNMTEAYGSLNSQYHNLKQSLILFSQNIGSIKDSLNSISSEVQKSKYSFVQDLLTISENMDTLLSSDHQRDIDHNNYKSNSQKSYDELNKKYLELIHSYENMEIELKNSKAMIQDYAEEKHEMKKETDDLNDKNNELRKLISNIEVELLDYKNVNASLEKKIIDIEREKELIEENFKQYVSLGDYKNLKSDKNKLSEIIQNLKNLNCTIKESCGDLISCDIKNLGDDFIHLKNIIHSLLEVRNKYITLELNYAQLMLERNELLSKIDSLNNLIKESVETQKAMKDEIQAMIEKNSEKAGSLYSEKVTELLLLLDYEEPTKIDDFAWIFIEKHITKYKSMMNQKTESDLEEKISYLESQLYDAQDFKSKFSKELHMLKPDLDISYLMSLSLADLQKTMIIAIIEKEKDVVGDYEMKIASSTDRIQQLEEQQKRREEWLQEIEKENERLNNECKQFQDDNEILKADVSLKIRKIIELEHQITQQINGEQIREYIKEREDSNNQLETAANEKNTLRLSIVSLNEKLQNKSIECEEVYNSLQKKAEVIFGLEKVLSKCKTENANLEKEVQHLRESMVLNLNNFNDNKQTLERDLALYKVQIEKLHQLLSDTNKEINTENKSVTTDIDENIEMELKIQGSLSNHLDKIESLNLKIDDLNSQLKQQNNKFDEEFENQAKFIERLEKELNMANELNAVLKNKLISIHNHEEDPKIIEELQSEIASLRELNGSLENEKALHLKEKEVLVELRIMYKEKESLIDDLTKEIETVKHQLIKEEDEKKIMQEEIDSLLLKLDSVGKDLTSAQKTIEDLLKQNLENEGITKEVLSLNSEVAHCKMEIITLTKVKEMKENQLSECLSNLNLEKEISCSVKSTLEKTQQELLNLRTEKAHLIEEHYKELRAQKEICSKLNSDYCQMKEINALQENELVRLKKELQYKVAYLEEISSNSHSENSCPFKKEAEDLKTRHDDLNKQLEHERETFKLWKTNLEEDLHCKLLKISDLELKLKKETQCYKEALMGNSELNQKLQESLEKFKRLEDKIALQRDVFIKEKSKCEMDLQNKDKMLIEFEERLLSVKSKCEEFSKDIYTFLEELSIMMEVDVINLSSALTLINNLTKEKLMLVKELKKTQEKFELLEKELKEVEGKAEFFDKELKNAQEMIKRLEEELKEAQEKAEQLEEECEELNNDIKYHENEIGNLYKNGKLQEEKWMEEKQELEKELLLTHQLKEKISSQEQVILSLQTTIENYNTEKEVLRLEKVELGRKITDLEKSLQSLKNQEISYLDGIKREMNHLKLELVNKNKAISKLEMRLESDTLPFQKKAELAERRVEELAKELRILKQSYSIQQMPSALTSPMSGLEMSSPSHKNKDKIIERLEQEVKQLVTEKSALKLLAQNRRAQINELREQLGKKGVHSFQD